MGPKDVLLCSPPLGTLGSYYSILLLTSSVPLFEIFLFVLFELAFSSKASQVTTKTNYKKPLVHQLKDVI